MGRGGNERYRCENRWWSPSGYKLPYNTTTQILMKIYVAGCSTNKFLPMDNIREPYYVDQPHEGRNIDFLNKWYCELTALFYLWQHTTDDVIGLEHYRAYFWYNGQPLCESDANDLLKTSDIIVPAYSFPAWGKPTPRVELDSQVHHTTVDFINTLRKFDKTVANCAIEYLNGNSLYCCNMFVAPRTIIDKWCRLIFPVLAEFEKKHPLNQWCFRREGYFTEFLLGAYLLANNYVIKPVTMLKLKKDLSAPDFWCCGPNRPLLFH